MIIQPDLANNRLVVELTPEESRGLALFPKAITELQTYATNFFTNRLNEHKQAQRTMIAKRLETADDVLLAKVLEQLA